MPGDIVERDVVTAAVQCCRYGGQQWLEVTDEMNSHLNSSAMLWRGGTAVRVMQDVVVS